MPKRWILLDFGIPLEVDKNTSPTARPRTFGRPTICQGAPRGVPLSNPRWTPYSPVDTPRPRYPTPASGSTSLGLGGRGASSPKERSRKGAAKRQPAAKKGYGLSTSPCALKKRCSRGSGQLQEGPTLQGRLAASPPEKQKKKKQR